MSDSYQPPTRGAGPPPGPPVHPGGSPRSGRRRLPIMAAVAIVAVIAIVGAAFVAVSFFGGDPAGAEVTLQSFGSSGDDPFTPSVAPEPSASLSDFAESGPPEEVEQEVTEAGSDSGGYRAARGTVRGVFGGTLNEQACDAAQLIGFLASEPDKAAAWASVLGIDEADIAPYLDGLTAANLAFDTRVLDHGFSNGEAAARESILQRGTAVLVDGRGVPRVNCYSGNPLLDPTVVDNEDYVGDEWAGFNTKVVLIIVPAPTDAPDLVLVDVETGGFFDRPAGTDGESDRAGSAEEDDETTVDLAAAGSVELNTPIASRITESENEIRYEVQVPDSAILTLSVANKRESISNLGVALLSGGDQIQFFRVRPGGSDEFSITLDHDGGAPFEIVFTEGPAEFEFTAASELQNDAGSATDAGDDFASAIGVASGQQVGGLLGNVDESDRYTLPIEGGPALVLTRQTDRSSDRAAAFGVEIAGEKLDFARVNPGAEDTFSLLLGPEDVGPLEVVVTEGPADYSFVAELIPQSDGGQPGDAPADLPNARTLDSLTDIVGEVGERDTGDYYLFDATADEMTIEVSVDEASPRAVGVQLLGSDGNSIAFYRVQPGATMTETFEAISGETHRLVVTEGRGVYTISLS